MRRRIALLVAALPATAVIPAAGAGATPAAAAAYCAVRATIALADTLVMRPPVHGRTQRCVQTGCGGLCGMADIRYTEAATRARIDVREKETP